MLYPVELSLNGKTAAVAAASAGLGFATAAALAAEGVRVVICGRDRDRIDAAAARIGGSCTAVVADVSTPAGGTAFIAAATAALGASPDILIANSGGPPRGGFDDVDMDGYRAALDQNLLSTVAMCQAAIPAMRDRGWGRVVAITSAVVKQPVPYLILSNTARAAVHGFLKTTAATVAPDGVTVNALMPGGHATDRMKKLYGDSFKPSDIPVGHLGSPDDFGAIATFLCSPFAKSVTGSSIVVDGGGYQGLF